MKIAINKPCHEDWEKMTPNEQGVFCTVCTKNVIDFTSKTLDEIKSFFSKPMDGRVCARFKEEQLDTLNVDSFVERFIGMRLTRKIAMIVALAFVSWLSGVNTVNAQDENTKKGRVSVKTENPGTVSTSTVTPTKVGMVAPMKDTTKCVKDPKTNTDGKGKTGKKKEKNKNTTTANATTQKPKEEKIIMGDVAP
ncbi:MAG: hypothetical protein K0S33_1469 [Bacteroidetes bacterium]|jgi:hypothetical protein|nr:hypothetical protein [Bacteroidota bacterium]